MAKQTINIGTSANSKDGDIIRDAFNKVNQNFTELYAGIGAGNVAGDITFSGIEIQGATTVNANGSIELVPNPDLKVNGQYLNIYPTNAFDYPHVHIAAGAGGELYIGDDNNFFSVGNDGLLKINSGSNLWQFDTVGDLNLPVNGGIVFDRANTSIRVGMGFHIASGEGIDIQAIDQTDPDNLIYKNWYFGTDGNLTFPDATVQTTAYPGVNTVAKTGSGVPGTGEVATITLNPTNNTNFVPGTYYGIFLGIGSGFNMTFDVAVNGDLTATIVSSNGGFVGGETGSINGVAIAGGTTGVDDIGVTVATLTNIATPTALDLTKQVQKLTDGYYTLADGTEGQVMHLVRQTGATVSITVIVANARVAGAQYTTIEHYPFTTGDMNMLIFTDGAWQAMGGTWD